VDGKTALMVAAEQGQLDMLEVLAEDGALNAVDRFGGTAVTWAAGCGHQDAVELLKAKGAEVTLPVAVMLGDREATKRLLAVGSDVNARDRIGRTALMIVCERGQADAVRLLLKKGAEVNAKDNFGRTALMVAARAGQPDVVELLLEKGADANAKDNDGMSALQLAKARGHKEIAELLTAHGAKE